GARNGAAWCCSSRPPRAEVDAPLLLRPGAFAGPGRAARRRAKARDVSGTPVHAAAEKWKKFENPLAPAQRHGIDNSVPPYGSFGDWATPKRSAAELFFSPLLTASPSPPFRHSFTECA